MSALEVRLRGRIGALSIDCGFTAPLGVTVLQGPSGAGKTTLLRAIAGLERLAGAVRLGSDVWQEGDMFAPPHRRRVGFVFQGANLLPHLSVRANLAYAAQRAEVPLTIEEAARRTGAAALLDRAPATLSGGEAQRVALARALLIQPRLLLLDEPLSALDGSARSDLIAQLATSLSTLSVPVLLVSHDPREFDGLAVQQLRMTDGGLA